jgi:hypothetical protein
MYMLATQLMLFTLTFSERLVVFLFIKNSFTNYNATVSATSSRPEFPHFCMVIRRVLSLKAPAQLMPLSWVAFLDQGSVLGPNPFILFMTDIDVVCQSSTKLKIFAHDIKRFCVVAVEHSSSNSVSLQPTIDNICVWASDRQFSTSVSKNNILTLSNKLCSSFSRSYSINHINLPNSDVLSDSDLGIMMDSCLSFTY